MFSLSRQLNDLFEVAALVPPITTEMNGAAFKANYRAASRPTAESPQDARSSQTPIWQGTNLQL